MADHVKTSVRYNKNEIQGTILLINSITVDSMALYGPSINCLGYEDQEGALTGYFKEEFVRQFKSASRFSDVAFKEFIPITETDPDEKFERFIQMKIERSDLYGRGSLKKKSLVLFVNFTRIYNEQSDIKYDCDFVFYDTERAKIAYSGNVTTEAGVGEREGSIDQIWRVSVYGLVTKILSYTQFSIKAMKASEFN